MLHYVSQISGGNVAGFEVIKLTASRLVKTYCTGNSYMHSLQNSRSNNPVDKVSNGNVLFVQSKFALHISDSITLSVLANDYCFCGKIHG